MSSNPIVILGTTSIAQIEKVFKTHKIWSVLVGDSRKYIGVITRKDLKFRRRDKKSSATAVEIMSKNVYTIDQEDDVIKAISIILEKNVNGLAVTNRGLPCGIITQYDIREKYNRTLFNRRNIQRDPQSRQNVQESQVSPDLEKPTHNCVLKNYDSIQTHQFLIALSFSGKYRDLIDQVADGLATRIGKSNVFYDFFYNPHLAQPDLDLILQKIYKNNSKLNVIFLSADYESKEWCGIEFRVIRELIKEKQTEKIMLLKIDDFDIKGLLSIDGYLDIRKMRPPEIIENIIERSQGIPVESIYYKIESDITIQPVQNDKVSASFTEGKIQPDPTKSITDITHYTRRLR